MLAVIVGFLSIHSTIALNCGTICVSLFQPYFNKNGITSNKRTVLNMALETPDKITTFNNEKLAEKAAEFSSLRNLKTVPVKEDGALLGRWNELKGLSEKELIIASSSSILKAERNEIALGLAYKRCEYVTQLFSKTFYMGTSLMRPDARAHVSWFYLCESFFIVYTSLDECICVSCI
jgi:hypothetical protein